LLLVGHSIGLMFLLAVPAGAAVGPLVAAESHVIGGLNLAGMRTEAFTWMLAATFVGFGAGSAAAGAIVDAQGWRWAILSACALSAAAAVLLLRYRAVLESSVLPRREIGRGASP
jgi:hypothetical protein